MNLLDTYNNCLKELTIYINNFEYEIKLLTVLLQMLKIDTDNPIFQMMINTLSNNTYGFIKDLKIIIDDNKQIVSEACLHNKSHLPFKELQMEITNMQNLLESNKKLQEIINIKVINLIKHKYLIDDLSSDNSLGL